MRTHSVKRAAVAALATASLVALAACSPGGTSSSSTAAASTSPGSGSGPATVTVAYVALPLFEPLFVAMHDGYFAQRGITVHLTTVGSGQSATTLAATNKVQAVLGGFSAGMFNAVDQGLDFTVVGSMAEEAPGTAANGLVIGKAYESKVKNAGDLKGMKIAVSGASGSAGSYLLAQALKPYGVTLNQVQMVNLAFPEMQSALKSGAVAAAYMSTPFLASTTSAGDGKLLTGAPVGVAVTGLIYGGQFAKSKLAQPFFDALVEASQKLQGSAANSTENLTIVAKATGEKLSALEAEPTNVFDPKLAPPTAALKDMQKVFLQDHTLNYTSPLPTARYVDSTFSDNAK